MCGDSGQQVRATAVQVRQGHRPRHAGYVLHRLFLTVEWMEVGEYRSPGELGDCQPQCPRCPRCRHRDQVHGGVLVVGVLVVAALVEVMLVMVVVLGVAVVVVVAMVVGAVTQLMPRPPRQHPHPQCHQCTADC